jgi:hypothetical protein
MRRRPRRRGGALLVAVATLAFSSALVAALADLVRTEVRLASERRRAARLLGALDACLADVVAELPAGWDFAAVLAGADAVAGTADDGLLPAPAGCGARARPAPGGAAPHRTVLEAEAQIGNARRILDALVRRTTEAGVGALLWLSAPPDAGAIAGLASFDGADPDTPFASLAAPADPETLDAWVAGEGARLETSPGTAPPVFGPPPPLADLGARILAGGPAGPEALVSGGTAVAGLAHVAGDLTIDDTRHGAGLLFVDGILEIRGVLEFDGVVVATGGIRVAPGGGLVVDGGLWLGVGAPSLSVEGSLALRRGRDAIAAADALLPLPRRATVASARDMG